MDKREQKIREHAYRIWEEAGRPEGAQDDHWRQAEEEFLSKEPAEADAISEENWRVEAGLPDEKPKLDIAPTIVAPD